MLARRAAKTLWNTARRNDGISVYCRFGVSPDRLNLYLINYIMQNSKLQTRVAIVGGGAVGKTAALALAQAGVEVALLSPESLQTSVPQQWDVRVFALNKQACQLLQQVKVWDAMDLSRVAPVLGMDVYGSAAQSGQLNFSAYQACQQELAFIVEDSNLNYALDTALRFANCQRLQTSANSMRVQADGVTLGLADGGQLQAELVIGADGANSWVRHQADIGYGVRHYHQKGVVANFECSKPHRGIARQWFVAEQGIIALLPLPGQRVSLVWSAPDELAAILLQQSVAELAARLAPYAEAELGSLTPVLPELHRGFPLRLIKPNALVADRVALIGDAAHVVHPLAGHGMNLGFADIRDFLRVLSECSEGQDLGEQKVLQRYQRLRKEEVLLMQVATDGLARLFATELSPVKEMREFGMNLLNRLPVIKNRLIQHALGK